MAILRIGPTVGGLEVPLYRDCSSDAELVLKVDGVETDWEPGEVVTLRLGDEWVDWVLDGAVASLHLDVATVNELLQNHVTDALLTYTPAGGEPTPWFGGAIERHP